MVLRFFAAFQLINSTFLYPELNFKRYKERGKVRGTEK